MVGPLSRNALTPKHPDGAPKHPNGVLKNLRLSMEKDVEDGERELGDEGHSMGFLWPLPSSILRMFICSLNMATSRFPFTLAPHKAPPGPTTCTHASPTRHQASPTPNPPTWVLAKGLELNAHELLTQLRAQRLAIHITAT